MIKKNIIHLYLKVEKISGHMRKISGQVTKFFRYLEFFLTHARILRTHAGNFRQSGNLLCHMIENQHNIFV